MSAKTRIALSSDHAAITLRQTIARHIVAQGFEPVDIGPTSPESTHYPAHGEAAARLVASGDCALGIILCGTGQGIMMAANKVRGVRCGVCSDAFSARMIRQHNDANMLSLGARVIGEPNFDTSPWILALLRDASSNKIGALGLLGTACSQAPVVARGYILTY